MVFKESANNQVIRNYTKVRASFVLIPLLIVVAVIVFLYWQGPTSYVSVQQEVFHLMNEQLSQFPSLEYNLTQLGDAFVALALLSVFLIYTPKIWEALLVASLVSLLFSKGLKSFFDVPRPVTFYGEESVNIVGETLVGYSSFPSGHSITIFTVLTVLMFAFIPQGRSSFFKVAYFLVLLFVGIVLATTRIGVGAHHPIDVLIGSILGYISGVIGIRSSVKYRLFGWVSSSKSYPFFMLLFLGSVVFMSVKIMQEHLVVFYFPLISLIVSLYLMIKFYVKKNQ